MATAPRETDPSLRLLALIGYGRLSDIDRDGNADSKDFYGIQRVIVAP